MEKRRSASAKSFLPTQPRAASPLKDTSPTIVASPPKLKRGRETKAKAASPLTVASPTKVASPPQGKRGPSVLLKAASQLKVPSPIKVPSSDKAKRDRTPSTVYNAPDDSDTKRRAQPKARKPKDASPPKTTSPTNVSSPKPAQPKASKPQDASPPKITSPPKVSSPPKPAHTAKVTSPPKANTSLKVSSPPNSKTVTPITVKFPSPPRRPSTLPPKHRPAEGGHVKIDDITPTSDMTNKTVRCRVNSVTHRVLGGNNMVEIIVSQVTSTIGVQIWLREKIPQHVFPRMPQEGHILQISRVNAKKSTFDPARYHEAMLSAGEKIVLQFVDDKATIEACRFVHDPIPLNGDSRSASVSTSASQSQAIPELNLDTFFDDF